MHINELNTRCEAIETKLTSLGFVLPEVTAYLRFAGSPVCLKVTAQYSRHPHADDLRSPFFYGDDPETALHDLETWIGTQPTPNEVREKKFLERLAALTEEARDMNMPILPDLEATMKRLSTNILEHW